VRFLSQRCSFYFKTREKFGFAPLDLGTNYLVFRNVEFFSEINFSEENKESDGIFENISLIEMKSLKLISYSRNMCRNGQAN
jgi:hypothetical protein